MAIKRINKLDIFLKNCALQLEIERLILGLNDSHHIVNLLYTFKGNKNIYFGMEFMEGGSLGNLIESEGRFEVEVA